MGKSALSASRKSDIVNSVDRILRDIRKDHLSATIQAFVDIAPEGASDLEVLIERIFQRRPNNPGDCKMYVDLLCALHKHYPEFPAELEGGKPCSVKRVLVCICQQEFEQILTTLHHEDVVSCREGKMLGTISCIGHLFVRNFLAIVVVEQIVNDLLGIQIQIPDPCLVELSCEFLMLIGTKLESTQVGKTLMASIYNRLFQLRREIGADGVNRISKQCYDQIDNLLLEWESLLQGMVDLKVSRMDGQVLLNRQFLGKVKIWQINVEIRNLTGVPIVEQRIISDGRILKADDTLERMVEENGTLEQVSKAECSMVQSCMSEMPRRIICILNLPRTQEPKKMLRGLIRRLGAQRPSQYSFKVRDLAQQPETLHPSAFALLSFKTELEAQFVCQLNGCTVQNRAVEVKFLQHVLALPEVDTAAVGMVDALQDEMRRELI